MGKTTEILEFLITSTGADAVQGFKAVGTAAEGVKGKLAETEGAFGKLKGSASNALAGIGISTGVLAAGAGAAIGGFVAKSISDFQNLALSAKNFSTVTGTTVQDASRWIEVASDLGVQTDTVQGAMQRLNREADQGKLAKFGIDATNANDRLIQSVQYLASIKDETQRSQAAFEMFGKSSASLAPLVTAAAELKGRMDDVSGAKIISDKNVADAKQFRDDLDRVTDAVDNLVLSAGKIALPFVDALTQVLGPLAELIGKVSDARAAVQEKSNKQGSSWTDDMIGFMTQTGPEAVDFWLNKVDEATGGTGDRFGKTGEAAKQLGDIVEGQGKKFVILGKETKDVTGMTDDQIRALVAQDAAMQTSSGSTDDNTKSQAELAKASKEAEDAIINLGKALGDQADAMRASSDSSFAADKAARDVSQTFEDLPDKLKKIADSTDSAATKTRESQQAYDDAAEAASKNADAQVKLATDQTAATGATITHTAALDTWNATMLTSAANADGPLHEAIINHIAAVNGIPPEKVTEILASTPNLDEQKAAIDAASANRQLTILADANTSAASAAVAAFIRNVESHPAYIDVIGRLSNQGVALAGGGPGSGLALVGEQGPELVALPQGSYVYTSPQTQAMMAYAGVKGYAGGGSPSGKTLEDLFGPSGQLTTQFGGVDANDPLSVLFGPGGPFAAWTIPDGPYRGKTLGSLFGPGGQFYKIADGGTDVLASLFGTGSDFANFTGVDPAVPLATYVPPQSAEMKKLAANIAAVSATPTLMPFGWFSDAAGLHGPSGQGLGMPTTAMPAMPAPPAGPQFDFAGLPMSPTPDFPAAGTMAPSAPHAPSSFAPRAVGGGGRQGINITITGGLWLGSKAEIGRALVEAVKAYERNAGPVFTNA